MKPTETEAARATQGREPSIDATAPSVELEDPSLYFNRELSWLEFNDRVLQLAEDPSLPLLERVRFCSIWESNLDEFFMVRVANLHDHVEAGRDARGPDGMAAREQIAAIRERVVAQRQRLGHCFEREIQPALSEHGIRLISVEGTTDDERAELERVFRNQVFPVLTPLVIGLGRPFPYISNLSLSLAVVLRDPDQDVEVLARVKVPKELLRRFIPVDDEGTALVALDDLIAANLGELFPGMEVLEHSFFRVTRDTDYDVSDEADDLLQAVEEELRRRRFGEVVRLEVAATMPERLREQLVSALRISDDQVYEVEGMLDLSDLSDVVDVKGFAELRQPPQSSVVQPRLLGEDGSEDDVFAQIREGDILVHHPYDSFTNSVVRFVKQAVCMVELKARFDERTNIQWAKKLEEAGVHVVYGLPALKAHCKCVLVVRREGDGVRHYVHVGTGNYNPKTARLYTDLGLFTCDPELGADIAEMFNYLTGYARPRGYRKALIAPFNLQREILAEIDRTIDSHSADSPARIRLKMNSLLDATSIQALYRASQAGVRVQLNVRGICALRPGVEGVSEGIEVVSIVDRFLEHSRIFSFERAGEPERVYIGSADLMPRNLYNRVELATPVTDERLRADLLDVLDRAMADSTNAWTLGEDGAWTRRRPDGQPRNLQREMIERHAARAAEGSSL